MNEKDRPAEAEREGRMRIDAKQLVLDAIAVLIIVLAWLGYLNWR